MNLLGDLVEGIKKIPSKISNVFDDNVPEAAQMFGNYLGAEEKDVYDYSVPRLRKTKTVSEGEVLNQERLLDTLQTTNKLRRRKANGKGYDAGLFSLGNMMDGDSFELDDYFDVDRAAKKNAMTGDVDLAGSLGSFKLKSKSRLHFIKFGNKLLPYGYVEHVIANEKYDFHPGAFPYGTFGKSLEDKGLARSYPVKATWKTYPVGVIKIENGKIDRSGIEWDLLR